MRGAGQIAQRNARIASSSAGTVHHTALVRS